MEEFRIDVSIIRGTSAGRALELMARGIQCSALSIPAAEKIVEEYLDAASAVLKSAPAKLVFGTITIINLTKAVIVSAVVITNNATS